MRSQINLFPASGTAQPALSESWSAVPEEARTRVRDLFVGLALRCLQVSTKGKTTNECQLENHNRTPDP
jgi:hypothetical protein